MVTALIEQLSGAWRRVVGPASRSAALALVLAVLLGGAHLARLGTDAARAVVGVGLALSVGVVLLRSWLERRAWRSARRTIHRVLVSADPALGRKALRALSLAERTAHDSSAGSAELAALHLERLMASVSVERVSRAATRRASRYRVIGYALIGAAFVALLVSPARVVEGLDVLVARHGRAPLHLAWLDAPQITAKLPAYLRAGGDRLLSPGEPVELPIGTQLVFRGVPLRPGRALRLHAGEREVPFVADGAGAVVARWTVMSDVRLRVVARFGNTLIEEAESLEVRAVTDRAPLVELESAPRTMKLAELDRLELRYDASDDHGLRQIDLVLRSGGSEDRRTLSRLDGEVESDAGGAVLQPDDPFLRRMFLPVVVTVEALDNDPVAGSKWGKSDAITIVPPAVGEPEARRFAALLGLRDELTDLLARELDGSAPRDHLARSQAIPARVSDVVDASYGGLSVPSGLSAFLLGQARALARPLRPGESLVRKTEDVLLAFDVALRTVGANDARAVARRLADVAEEAAEGAKLARESERQALGLARVDVALDALAKGARELRRLDALGRDLGSVAAADLGRARSARARSDMTHTELAARHLAARLRRPEPSFGSARTGGVESGAGSSRASGGKASQAADHFDQLASELQELVRDHATELGSVERSLSEAEQSVDMEALREEARRHAEAVRGALRALPLPGSEPGTARAAAALGREHAGAMAESLERLSFADAVNDGRDALAALSDAEKKAAENPNGAALDRSALLEARQRLGAELSWAEQQLTQLKQQAQARSRGALEKSSRAEQGIARRAGNLADRGKNAETALPEDAIGALERAAGIMREASRELANGRGDRGLELQRQAQRLLEQASTGKTTDSNGQDDGRARSQRNDPSEDGGEGGKSLRMGGEVPHPGDGRSAEDFQRRVLQGLGKAGSERLSPAVKRYAEGLLQ